MEIHANIEGNDGLKKKCTKNGKWIHSPGQSIRLLPFRTKFYEACLEDLKSFQGIVGECIRISTGVQFPKELKTDKEVTYRQKIKHHLLEQVKTKVDTDRPDEFKDIVIKLFFEENENLIKFNRRVLPYLNFNFEHKHLLDTSKFIYDLFLSADNLPLQDLGKSTTDNVFYKLITDCLPELKEGKLKEGSKYDNLFEEVTRLFRTDLEFVASDEQFFLEHIEDLFRYYYFFYTTQLARSLSNLGKQEIKPIFFSMDWETLSESRLAYLYGWRTLAFEIDQLFSHINALEILNYITVDGQKVGDYKRIRKTWANLNLEQQSKFVSLVNQLSEFYSAHIEGLEIGESWEKCEEETLSHLENKASEIDGPLDEALTRLYRKLRYQFRHSERKAAHDRYGRWLDSFVRKNFTKTRGRLGATTVFSQEHLLFLVKLCVGKEEKIRLNRLWQKMEERGISFDEPSKNEIIKLFERINLLEKKSDSGDAQYVKSII